MRRNYKSFVTYAGATELAELLTLKDQRIERLEAQIRSLGDKPVVGTENQNLLKRVDAVSLSRRELNKLLGVGIEYVYQLVVKTERELLEMPGFGKETLHQIKWMLCDLDLSLGMRLSDGVLKKIELL